MNDELIERALRGEASEAELIELVAWRRAAPEHERHYRRTQRLIAAARALRTDAAASPTRPSAATIIAAASASSPAATARLRRPRLRLGRLAPWAVAAAAVLVAVLNLRDGGESRNWVPAEIITGAAELATVRLADGTVVRLAPSSRLRVEAGRAREVRLDGRALFAVTKQPGEPFRVRTQLGTARVLGTRFELATDQAELRLRVLEGRVALDAPRNRVEVGAGEESGVRDGVAARPTQSAATDVEPAWAGRFLAFQATPLRDAVRRIERLYQVSVVVSNPALATATITATFTDRSLDDVISVVCEVLSANCSVRDGVVSIGI